MTNTEYVTALIAACGIKEHTIRSCQGTRSSVQEIRDKVEEIIVEIREDTGPQTYCEPMPLIFRRPSLSRIHSCGCD